MQQIWTHIHQCRSSKLPSTTPSHGVTSSPCYRSTLAQFSIGGPSLENTAATQHPVEEPEEEIPMEEPKHGIHNTIPAKINLEERLRRRPQDAGPLWQLHQARPDPQPPHTILNKPIARHVLALLAPKTSTLSSPLRCPWRRPSPFSHLTKRTRARGTENRTTAVG
jgi:hypothetical protein